MVEKFIEENKTEKYETASDIQNYGWGIRHLQMACMTLNLVCLIIARASMGIAVLAMSDTQQKNSTIPIYDWDKKTQSLILSSFFWGYVVMQVPSGILAKKFGGKPILLVSLLANALLCLSVPTLAALGGWQLVCAARLTMGLTQSCLFSSTHTLLGQWLPANERTNYTGIVYGGIQFGTIIAMPLCGYLAETALGWKLIFYVTSGILIGNLAIWYFLGANCPREHRWISAKEKKYIESGLNVLGTKRPPTPWKLILRSKPVLALLAPQSAFIISFVFFFVDMPTYLEKGLKISLKSSALLAALPYIGMWFGNTISAYLSEKISNKGWLKLTTNRKLFQSISLFGIAIALVFLSFLGPENKTLAVISLVACLTMHGFSTAGFVVNQLDLSPNYAGVIMSLLNFIANGGSALTPIVTSVILRNDPSDVSRWKIVFLLMAGMCAVGNVIYLFLGTSERQPWDDPNYQQKMLSELEELKPVLDSEKNEKKKSQMTN